MRIDNIEIGEEYAHGRYGSERIRATDIVTVEVRGAYSFSKSRNERRVQYEVLDKITGAVIRDKTTPNGFVPPWASVEGDEKWTAAKHKHDEYLASFVPGPLLTQARDIECTWAVEVAAHNAAAARSARATAADAAIVTAFQEATGITIGVNNVDLRAYGEGAQLLLRLDHDQLLALVAYGGEAVVDTVVNRIETDLIRHRDSE